MMMRDFWNDLVCAARTLARTPAFALVCIVSLGIGMGPVIAVPYLARIPSTPPPAVNTEGLVEVITAAAQARPAANSWSYADYQDLRDADTGMELFAWATAPSVVTLPTGGRMPLWPMYVSTDYFQTLRVSLARGPGFEGQPDAVVILGYQFWQTHLDADPQIVGKTLKLDSVPYAVAGIAPDQFQGHLGLQGREMFVPLERYPGLVADNNARADRGKEWFRLHGRLLPGASVAQASAAVAAVTAQLAKAYPATNEFKAGLVEPYDPLGVRDRSQFLRLQAVALTLTGAILLVVCLNLSGMMQVRSAMRERELSIRQAIGASRLRLARHLLAEAVLLAGVGGCLASLALFNAPTVISNLSGFPIPPQLREALKVDVSMIAICIGICFLTSLVFGFLPALRFSRPVIISSLKDDAGAGGFRVGRVHRFTAALQVAIAVPLLVMGGISLDRVRSTATADLGFEAELLYAAPLELDDVPDADFQIRNLRDNLAQASGVAAVTIADGLPLDFRYRSATVSLQAEANAETTPARVQVTRVGDGYLSTMGIPLLAGRDFSGDDSAVSERVTIISKPLADRLSANAADVIGKRLTFGLEATNDSYAADELLQTLTVVGVTADFPTSQMSTEREQLLLPLAQHSNIGRNSVPVDDDDGGMPRLLLIARSAAGEQPQRITAELENVVRELDPEFQRDGIVTGAGLRQKSMDDFLSQAAVGAVTGGVVLLLSALGIYGVVGLMVATRRREIAVRAALGASRSRVMGMVLLDVVKLTAPGAALGLVLAAALIRLNAENMGVSLSDAELFAYVAGAVIAVMVAVLAGLAPARRAASVLPMAAMRSE